MTPNVPHFLIHAPGASAGMCIPTWYCFIASNSDFLSADVAYAKPPRLMLGTYFASLPLAILLSVDFWRLPRFVFKWRSKPGLLGTSFACLIDIVHETIQYRFLHYNLRLLKLEQSSAVTIVRN